MIVHSILLIIIMYMMPTWIKRLAISREIQYYQLLQNSFIDDASYMMIQCIGRKRMYIVRIGADVTQQFQAIPQYHQPLVYSISYS